MKFKFKVVGNIVDPVQCVTEADDEWRCYAVASLSLGRSGFGKNVEAGLVALGRSGMNYVNRETYLNHSKQRPLGFRWIDATLKSLSETPQCLQKTSAAFTISSTWETAHTYDWSPTILGSNRLFFFRNLVLLERPRRLRLAIALSSKFKIKSRDNKVNTLAVMQTNAKLGGK